LKLLLAEVAFTEVVPQEITGIQLAANSKIVI
jgi:hypothetical protein